MIEYLPLALTIWIAWELTSMPSPVLGGLRMYAEDDELKGKWEDGFILRKMKERKGQISVPEIDPVAGALIHAIIAIVLVVAVGNVVLETQKEAVHQAELEQCREKFGADFQNATMDGSYVCMKDGEVYDPEIHALNVGPTGNILVDMIVVPLSWFGGLPWWIRTPGMIVITLILFLIAARVGPR